MIEQISNPIVKPMSKGVIFTPSLPDIGNLEVNLDSSNSGGVVFDGSKISQWNDISGNGRHATQVSMASQPVPSTAFNVPGIEIAPADVFMNIPFTYDWTNNPFTLIAVASKGSGTSFRGIVSNRFGAGASNWFTLGQDGSNVILLERTFPAVPSLTSGFDPRNQPPQIYEYNHGTSDSLYINGVLADTDVVGNIGGLTNDLRIGWWVGALQGWAGPINQFLIWSKSINGDERFDILAALRPKWQGL